MLIYTIKTLGKARHCYEMHITSCVSDSHVFPIVYFGHVSFLQNDIIFLVTYDTGRTESPFDFIHLTTQVMLLAKIYITEM